MIPLMSTSSGCIPGEARRPSPPSRGPVAAAIGSLGDLLESLRFDMNADSGSDDGDDDARSCFSDLFSGGSVDSVSSRRGEDDDDDDDDAGSHGTDGSGASGSARSLRSYQAAGYDNEEDYLFDQYGGIGGTAEERAELAEALTHTLKLGPMADDLLYEEVAMCFLRCRERHRFRARREEAARERDESRREKNGRKQSDAGDDGGRRNEPEEGGAGATERGQRDPPGRGTGDDGSDAPMAARRVAEKSALEKWKYYRSADTRWPSSSSSSSLSRTSYTEGSTSDIEDDGPPTVDGADDLSSPPASSEGDRAEDDAEEVSLDEKWADALRFCSRRLADQKVREDPEAGATRAPSPIAPSSYYGCGARHAVPPSPVSSVADECDDDACTSSCRGRGARSVWDVTGMVVVVGDPTGAGGTSAGARLAAAATATEETTTEETMTEDTTMASATDSILADFEALIGSTKSKDAGGTAEGDGSASRSSDGSWVEASSGGDGRAGGSREGSWVDVGMGATSTADEAAQR